MAAKYSLQNTHPEGESISHPFSSSSPWPLDTPGGRFYAEWDEDLPVTREGQLIFFFQFLHTGGRWEDFLDRCPLRYYGNRGSGARNVMGTIFLSVLNGHWRYAHINSVRGDHINPQLLGMNHVVSEDTVRRGIKRIDEHEGSEWVRDQILKSISPVLHLPWILDIDTTIKTLYGHQQGAEVGYNPHKPGRPSHAYHSYFVANLRICLGVDALPGKQSASAKGFPGLWKTLDKLPRERWPTFVRGDCGYGSDKVMIECEQRNMPYLFKLRHTKKVKQLVQQVMHTGTQWHDTGDGWEAVEASLKLTGWDKERRVVLVREAPSQAPVIKEKRGRDRQQPLKGARGNGWDPKATPWSGKISVLVTSLDVIAYPTECMPKLYRERSDAENIYDELKNQWGWNGYTTSRLLPCHLMANLIALFYNWWHLYVRFYDEEHHREAITSRPALMQGVGRQVKSGGQKTIKVSLLHEKGAEISKAVTLISKELQKIGSIAEQWPAETRWTLLLTRILRRWLGGKHLPGLPKEAALLLSG